MSPGLALLMIEKNLCSVNLNAAVFYLKNNIFNEIGLGACEITWGQSRHLWGRGNLVTFSGEAQFSGH